jgi:hypothetical protein
MFIVVTRLDIRHSFRSAMSVSVFIKLIALSIVVGPQHRTPKGVQIRRCSLIYKHVTPKE